MSSSMSSRRQKLIDEESDTGMWIPGLGENKPRPQSSTSPRSGVSAAQSSTAGSSRSNSPRPDGGRRRQRPRTAEDSSQMKDALWQPKSPTTEEKSNQEEIEEEVVVAVDGMNLEAIPFSDYSNCNIFLIQGGLIVNHDGTQEADVLIQEGMIKEVGMGLEAPADCKVIDAKGKIVMPGGIDLSTNFHNRKSVSIKKADDFESGTKSALVGGTTMVVDLVVPEKGESLLEAFKAWKEDADDNACCDFAFRVAVAEWNDSIRDDIGELVKKEGVNIVKVYMSEKDVLMLKNEELLEAFNAVKELGAIVEVHAENGEIIAENEKRLLARGVTGPEGHLMACPEEVEEEAVTRALAFARQANVPLIVSSPTSPRATEIISKARKEGQAVIGGVTVAALALDGSHYYNTCWDHAAGFVTSPPLRDNSSYPEKLMTALSADDGLQLVFSDHKSYNTETKKEGKSNFKLIPKGVNGVEDRLSIVWENGVESGNKMEMERFVAVTSTNVAQTLNVYPQKGRIQADSDADVVVWNKNNLREISSKTHAQSGDFNVFEGIKVRGAPEFVFNRGKLVVAEYQVSASAGSGNFVELKPYPKSLYDTADAFGKREEKAKVERGGGVSVHEERQQQQRQQQLPKISSADFGITTPRLSIIEEPIMNKRLGIYQRPMSAHGIRNQQDSTFSLSGGYNEEGDRRSSVKVQAPPGGEGRAFW